MTGFIRSKSANRKRKYIGNNVDQHASDNPAHVDHVSIIPLNLKNVVPEMVLLGTIKEIYSDRLMVLLPDNLHGYVYACDMNNILSNRLETKINSSLKNNETTLIKLSEYFKIGQFVCCTVVSCVSTSTKSNRLRLSIKPVDIYTNLQGSDIRKGMILWGYISAKEDHGYEISFGSQILKGFFKSKKELKLGRMSFYVVTAEASAGRLYLVNDTFGISNSFDDMPFGGILPGNSVECLVVDSQPLGNVVKIFNSFDATITNFHLNDFKPCSINTTVEATVLFVDPLSKRIGLSVSPHLKWGSKILNNGILNKTATTTDNNYLKYISKYDHINKMSDGNIVDVFQHYGVVIEMENFKECYGILTKSWMKMPLVDGNINENYATDTSHKVKIIGYNPIDNLYILSDLPTIMNMPFITYDKVEVGSIIKGEILNICGSSITMEFGGLLRGVLPTYLTSKRIDSKKLLMEHKSIKCRVVECDPLQAKMLLSSSNDMINDKTPILSCYEMAKPGMSFVGFVLFTKENYCIVKFYNKVTGILHKNQTDDSLSGKSFMSLYKQGTIVKTFVYKCIPSERTLHLTLKDNSSLMLLENNDEAVQLHDNNGLACNISTPTDLINSSELIINVLSYEDPANNHIKMRLAHNDHFKKISQKKHHSIPIQQLSDFKDISSAWYKIIKRGGKKKGLDEAVVLGRNNNASLMITLKKSLLQASVSKKLPLKFEDLCVGQTLPGIVVSCMPNGLHVLIGFSLVGLLPVTNISNEYISSLESVFSIGQTILVTVHELSLKSKRFSLISPFKVASPSSKTYCDHGYHGVGYLENYMEQKSLIERALMEYSSEKSIPKTGEYVDLVVKRVKSHEKIVCKLMSYSSKCKVVYLEDFSEQYNSFKPSQKIKGLVVAINIVDNIVFVVALTTNTAKKNRKIEDSHAPLNDKGFENTSCNYKLDESQKLTVVSINDHHITCVDTEENPLRTVFYGVGIKGFGDLCNLSQFYIVGQSVVGSISKILANNKCIFTPDDFRSNLLTRGDFEPCKVHNINGCFVYVHVKATNQLGRVHVSELSTNPTPFSNPLSDVLVGSSLNGAVIGQVEPSISLNKKGVKKHSDRLLEMSFTHTSNDHKFSHSALIPGQKVVAYVKDMKKNSVILTVNPDVTAVMDNIELLNYKKDFDFKSLKVGVALYCIIQNEVDNKTLKCDRNIFNVGLCFNACKPPELGSCLVGRVIKYLPNYGQLVKLSSGTHALLPITEVDDKFTDNPQDIHPVKSTIECVVVDIESQKNIIVSTKKTLLSFFSEKLKLQLNGDRSHADFPDRAMKSMNNFGRVGSTHQGYIKLLTNHYALIMLSFKVTTKVQGQEFFKWFTPQSIKNIQLPALVSVKILSKAENSICVSIVDCKLRMKDSSCTYLTDPLIDPCNQQNSESHACLLIGKYVEATVEKIDTQLGLHLKVTKNLATAPNRNEEDSLAGLIPLTQISDCYTRFPLHKFKPSQMLNVLVVAKCRFKNVLLCSLRESLINSVSGDSNNQIVKTNISDPDFNNTFELAADQCLKGYVIFISPVYITVCVSLNVIGVITQKVIEMLPQNKLRRIKLGDLLNLQVVRVLDKHHIEVCLQNMSKALTNEITSVRTSSKPMKVVVAPNLLNTLLNKDAMRDIAFLNSSPGVESIDTDVHNTVSKKLALNKSSQMEEHKFQDPLSEEKFIRKREQAIVEGQLETIQDYERECLSNPNDSQGWIRYVAFVMDMNGDIEQARHIIKRSLNVINYRNENDRFNMWICLLNLENEFGTEGTMDQVYKQASQLCDKKQLLKRLTMIYYSSGKVLKAEEIHNLLIKKFSHSKKSWLLYLQFLYQNLRLDDARKLLPRALRSLDKKKHIDCLVKNGLLEFKYGDNQRACSIFDGILKNYPNRMDIWFVLIDQHIKQSNTEFVRDLFERLLSLGLNPKRMKSVFKKYADFEKALPSQVSKFSNVQEKAFEYLKMQNSNN